MTAESQVTDDSFLRTHVMLVARCGVVQTEGGPLHRNVVMTAVFWGHHSDSMTGGGSAAYLLHLIASEELHPLQRGSEEMTMGLHLTDCEVPCQVELCVWSMCNFLPLIFKPSFDVSKALHNLFFKTLSKAS